MKNGRAVTSTATLIGSGMTRSAVAANLSAGRWQRCGHAVVMHSGPLTRSERWHAALINTSPGALLTAFTAAELCGLRGWEREAIDVLAPRGESVSKQNSLPIVLHRSRNWPVPRQRPFRCHLLSAALVIAAGSFDQSRHGCGILAAAVQQRLTAPGPIREALQRAPRVRHRAILLAAVDDIEGGSQALSEIDLVRLCRRAGLPVPEQQKVRSDRSGRRRYLDAAWRRADGRLVVVEVDGALHLNPRRWWDDQLRQNELSLADALVLRFPSAVVRAQPQLVIEQLRIALRLPY
jgi:hypothetical protein